MSFPTRLPVFAMGVAAGLLQLREDDIHMLPPWPLLWPQPFLPQEEAPWARRVDLSSCLLLASILLSLVSTWLPGLNLTRTWLPGPWSQLSDVLQFAAVYPQVTEFVPL